MTTERKDMVWQSAEVAHNFLQGMRGAMPLANEQFDVMLRVIRAARSQPGSFLDVGCGDGIVGHAILSQCPEAHGVFLDFSKPMIEAAKSKLAGKYPKLTFVAQDYGLPEWVHSVQPYAPFDAIVSGYSIHHQPDQRKREIYEEIFSLLKPGGVFLNIEHVAPPSTWVERLFDELYIDARHHWNQANGVVKTREEVAQEFHNRQDKQANILAPLEAQCDWLRDIGFIHVDCFLKIFELALFGGVRPATAMGVS
jgi:ubiquinone/menaquinone biosynthesis C-methylase UbiE